MTAQRMVKGLAVVLLSQAQITPAYPNRLRIPEHQQDCARK